MMGVAYFLRHTQTGKKFRVLSRDKEAGTVKLKGSFDDGTMTLQLSYAPGDAGQVLLETALDDDDFYSFELTLQNGTIIYFQAQVNSAPVNVGTTDTITGMTVSLGIKSGSIVKKHPA